MITFVDENGVEDMCLDVQDEKMLVNDRYVKWFIHCQSFEQGL
ncbi:hypothetical protein SAMN02787081_02866 [Lysinibacillus fusiformis]|uniref:Uncharacterized protein n=1 Tax=Lysinibacillus fusiformis TaxID=28031 RepID=A0A1H9KZ82_9BACI|nr:hypothetical protein SAMN02787081_02866 [Lysinibacillus fusiformis]SEN93603.1 hypothetical protein SAMN02787103_02991 [Lysinibacillus fusiformis]SER04083.1 hypothetical protein SAMN02787113_02878 [Lysinibacillus fusiformis]